MRALLGFAVVLLAACAQPSGPLAASPAEPELVSLHGEGEFVETERTPEYSLVQVPKAPAGSVPSSMYTLRGVCAVLHARHAEYVSSETVPGAVPTFRLRFPAAVAPDAASGRSKSVFTSADCAALHF